MTDIDADAAGAFYAELQEKARQHIERYGARPNIVVLGDDKWQIMVDLANAGRFMNITKRPYGETRDNWPPEIDGPYKVITSAEIPRLKPDACVVLRVPLARKKA